MIISKKGRCGWVFFLNLAFVHFSLIQNQNLEKSDDFLKKGGIISVGKTKPLPSELGLSNNTWNNKLTREEKSARDGK